MKNIRVWGVFLSFFFYNASAWDVLLWQETDNHNSGLNADTLNTGASSEEAPGILKTKTNEGWFGSNFEFAQARI